MTEETKLVSNDEDSTPSKAAEVTEDSMVEEAEANGEIKDSDSAVKKGKKRKKSMEISEEFFEKRERSSRGAKTKAALQISLTSIKDSQYNFDVGTDNDNLVAVRRGRPKKIKYPDEMPEDKVMSCSPLKIKAGPKSKKIPLKPGPRRKRGRNFQLEDLYLDQPGLDEDPDLTKKFYDKKLDPEADKAQLKALVPVLDLKNARNPCTRAAFELAHDYWLTTGQFGGMVNQAPETSVQGNIVTVSYQRPPRMNTFNHKPDPTRVVISDFSKIQAQKKAAMNAVPKPVAPAPAAPGPNAKPAPDPLKPPPITNYMSVKIEILMNCLEKMYHNHLPLNAFTSRFPNARAKAALTLMLDSHRADCETCDKILEEANVGIFHGDEAKMKMDLEAFGPVIPTQAPVVDLSQYPDNVAEMKKLLVEKDAKIRALEKRIEALNKDVKTDEIDKLDLVEMLDGVNEPTMEKFSGKFLKTAGYRIVDLR